MKILLISIGTRGDCEPFLALANILRKNNNEITCAFPEQYRNLAKEENFEFLSLGTEFLDILDTNDGKILMGGKNKLKKFISLIKLSKKLSIIQKDLITSQKNIIKNYSPDYIIFHTKAYYPLAWHLKTNKPIMMFSTVPCNIHEIKGMPHVGINLSKSLNSFSYKLGYYGYLKGALVSLRNEVSTSKLKKFIPTMKILYNVSENIIEKPNTWTNNLEFSGFLDRNKNTNFSPSKKLTNFLEVNKKCLFLSFGSAVNTNSLKITTLFVEIFNELNIPAIINISGNGLVKLEDTKNIIFTNSIPYDYILPKVYGAIHHGGAGITNSTFKYGCVSMAIAHSVDQPMWNNIINKLNVGPFGIDISKLNKDKLKAKILDLYKSPIYKENSINLSKKLNEEKIDIYDFIIK